MIVKGEDKPKTFGLKKILLLLLLVLVIVFVLFIVSQKNIMLFKLIFGLNNNKNLGRNETPSYYSGGTSEFSNKYINEEGFSFNYPANLSFREYRETNTDRYDNSTQIIYGFLESKLSLRIEIEVLVNSRTTINNVGEYNQYLPQNLINSADYFFYCSAQMGDWICNAQSRIKFPHDANRLLYLNCYNWGKENFCHLIMPQVLSTLKFK